MPPAVPLPLPAPEPAPIDGDAAQDEAAIRRELLGAVLRNTRMALLGNLVIGATTVAVLTGSGIRHGVAAWGLAILSLVLVRALHASRRRPLLAALDTAGLLRTERELTLLLGLNGAAWGVLPWLGYSGSDPFVDFFTIAMLVGMTAGAVNSASPLPRALNTYLIAALVPFIVKSALLPGLVYWAGGLTIVFSLVVLMAFGRNAHRALRETLRVTRRNERLALALGRERDAVRTAMRSKDLFLAGVTHDLRQPVHALGLYLRYLRSLGAQELSPQALEAVCEPMDLAVRSMSRQLSRLLELARLEAGEVRVVRRPLELTALVRTLHASAAPLAHERGLRLQVRVPAVWLDSDPALLESILDNLLGNALRYTERGGVLLAGRRRGATLHLQVFDTGVGIAPEDLAQLFTPYTRFDDRRLNGDDGQGLGLALVHKQATLLGHGLHVRSVPGRGSVFTLIVPLAGRSSQ